MARSDIARIVPHRLAAALVAVVALAVALAILAGTASGGAIRVNASFGGCQPSGG